MERTRIEGSLASIWSVADDALIRTSGASRRIGPLGSIRHNGADRNIYLGANLWPRLQALDHIQGALGYLAPPWLGIGGPAGLQQNDDTAEDKATECQNLDVSS